MANDYFQFKQFRVVQRQAGMKVTTDSCVFGALLKNILPVEKINLLDIGTGTGLLALMVAQLRPEARMTAVEVDVEAFRQAQENIGKSPWSDRITLVHQAVQEYQKTASKKFEVIISNPPFYAAHQHSLDSRRAKAHHTVTLSQADLAATVEHLLMPDGIFVVLLPSFEMEKLRNELKQYGLHPFNMISVHNRQGDNKVFRVISAYRRGIDKLSLSRFNIRTTENHYSPEFIKYLAPFYLHL